MPNNEKKRITKDIREKTSAQQRYEDTSKHNERIKKEKELIKIRREGIEKTDKDLHKARLDHIGKETKLLESKWDQMARDFGKSIGTIGTKLGGTMGKGLDDFIGVYQDYYSFITTRLMGASKTYHDVLGNIQGAVGGNRAVSVLTVLNSLEKLIRTGVASNLEQRSFLDSVSNKIATTFESTNATLLQLTRLNRVDATAAYLGSEVSLTELLNTQFMDTNYLTSNVSDAVSSALYEATSQLGPEMGASFEFAVQKWLGSFYSSGMGASTVQNLAQGIGYLGSGNVEALQGNQSLNNMMAIASKSAGLDYGELLKYGLTPETVESLLAGVYKQGVTIAQSGDRVAQSQFANMFGMTISDLTSLMRLTTENINALTQSTMSYGDLVQKTAYELTQIMDRTPLTEQIKNVMSNVMAGVGEGIATNAITYSLYTLSNLIGTLDIPTPFGSVDAMSILRGSMVGWGAFQSLGSVLTGLVENRSTSLDSFDTYHAGYNEGGTLAYTSGQVVSTTGGYSAQYVAGSSADVVSSSFAGNEGARVISEATGADKTIADLYDSLNPAGGDNIYALLLSIKNNFDSVVTSGGVSVVMNESIMEESTR